jgi:hypothetical protein
VLPLFNSFGVGVLIYLFSYSCLTPSELLENALLFILRSLSNAATKVADYIYYFCRLLINFYSIIQKNKLSYEV